MREGGRKDRKTILDHAALKQTSYYFYNLLIQNNFPKNVA